MKKLMALVVVASAGLWLASCAEPATEDEVNQMCKKLGDLSAGNPDDARAGIAKAGAELDGRLQKLKDEQAEASKRIDAEQELAMADVKPQDAEKRTAIVTEFAKKQTDLGADFDAKINAVEAERDAAVKKATEAADTAEAAWNEVVYKCTADNKGAAKPQAQCRIAAESKDAWEKCE